MTDQLYRWVKASERLPKQATAEQFFVKYKGYKYTCKCIAFKFVFREGAIAGSNILGKESYDLIEWLEEYTHPLYHPTPTNTYYNS